MSSMPGVLNLLPADQKAARDVVFCGRILCDSANACSPNLVCEKLRSFKLRLRECRHEVTVDNC